MLPCSRLLNSEWLFSAFYFWCFKTQNTRTSNGLGSVKTCVGAAHRCTRKQYRWWRAIQVVDHTDLPSILLTQPCETRSCLEMSHGRTPCRDISTIRWRTMSGSGRPLTNTPPSWLTPPWPACTRQYSATTVGGMQKAVCVYVCETVI